MGVVELQGCIDQEVGGEVPSRVREERRESLGGVPSPEPSEQ